MGERILVVNDDERLGLVLRDGLAHYGYVVEIAADGPAALAPEKSIRHVLCWSREFILTYQ